MSSPIPGDDDEASEGSGVISSLCFEVVVGPRKGVSFEAEEEVVVVVGLRGGGGVCEFFNEIRRVSRCLCNMKSGMARTRLVPMNCGRCIGEKVSTDDIGSSTYGRYREPW